MEFSLAILFTSVNVYDSYCSSSEDVNDNQATVLTLDISSSPIADIFFDVDTNSAIDIVYFHLQVETSES